MSYRSRSQGNYGDRRRSGFRGGRKGSKSIMQDTKIARHNFEKRSKRSQVQDLIRMAPLSPNLEVYLKAPNKYDFPNVDTLDPKLIFSHKTHRQQAADLAKLASKVPVEIWVRNTAEHDIENVDTPMHRKKQAVLPAKTHKFRVKRKEAEKEELEKAEKPKKEKKPVGRKLPTKEEILEKAKEIAMIDQVKQGIEPITPETSELLESGVFEAARRELMTGMDTVVNAQVLQYVDQLKAELEPMGFAIVPLSEI